MTFVKTDCPECGERILLDVVNGYGYCMYCGAKVEPEGLSGIPAPVRSVLRRELDSDDPYEGRSWYPLVREAGLLMRKGDFDAACGRVRQAFDIAVPENEGEDVTDAVDSELIEAVLAVTEDPDQEPYRGGMERILEITSEHAEDGITPMFFEMFIIQFMYDSVRRRDVDRARQVLVSVTYVLRDALRVSTRPEDMYRLLMSTASVMKDVGVAYPDGAEDGEYADDEGVKCYRFVLNLTLLFASVMDGISQKELSRINRASSSVDRAEANAILDEAYAVLAGPDPGSYIVPLTAYVDTAIPRPAAKKKSR